MSMNKSYIYIYIYINMGQLHRWRPHHDVVALVRHGRAAAPGGEDAPFPIKTLVPVLIILIYIYI